MTHAFLFRTTLLISLLAGGMDDTHATELVFHPDWFDGPQFAGVHMAAELGFYREAGLEVRVEDFSFGRNTQAIIDETPARAALGTMEGYIFLQKRAAGADLVAITAMFHESPAGLISLESNPILQASDFQGRAIGVHPFAEPIVRWFARRAALNDEQWELRLVDDDLGRLERGEVAAIQGYAITELVLARRRFGSRVRFVSFRELGFDSYSQVVFTTRTQWQNHRAGLVAFVDATRRGWAYALTHREEAARRLQRRMQGSTDATLLKDMLDALAPYVPSGAGAIMPPLDPDKLEHMQAACVEMGLLDRVEPAGDLIGPVRGER